ncbi:hypothetical protein GGX14DRAFT_640820 [Mycena pura]|uniref:Trypsin-like peptidase domain-containing protein n=1 Tax=Mycena pura TaxID=153505 RepID=A0AAD6YPR7_9AGAR|nr:hypothetical protein GGX14DRAFT_640820 [Mycena pura]
MLQSPLLIRQYAERPGRVLASTLPYESRPAEQRRAKFDNGDSVVLVAHCARDQSGRHKVTIASGFVLPVPEDPDEGPLIATCAHTLEEVRNLERSPSWDGVSSGSFLVSGTAADLSVDPISSIVSALPRSDILLLRSASRRANARRPPSVTLPVSPYPAARGTAVRAHLVSHTRPLEAGWTPWVGGTWSRWVRGSVLAYRDFAGRETEPGTYDALAHMSFLPLPTPGSSGGPIVDEESGAVVGVVLGTRMDSRVDGVRGYGVPSETIYEMFSLPGLR